MKENEVWLILPLAIVWLSGQQPKSVSLQCEEGQPRFLGPRAADTPSSQQPYLDSLQVFGFGQPLSKGPLAGVILSQQQPYFVLRQVLILRLLHKRGFLNKSIIVDVPPYVVAEKKINVIFHKNFKLFICFNIPTFIPIISTIFL